MVFTKFAHVFKILHSVVHILTYGLILSHLQLWSNKAIFNSEVDKLFTLILALHHGRCFPRNLLMFSRFPNLLCIFLHMPWPWPCYCYTYSCGVTMQSLMVGWGKLFTWLGPGTTT